MKNQYDIYNLDLDNLKPLGFVNGEQLKVSIAQLKEVSKYIVKLVRIRESGIHIPTTFIVKINEYERELYEHLNNIESNESGTSEVIARRKDHVITKINEFHNFAFNLGSRQRNNNQGTLIEYYSLIKAIYDTDKPKDTKTDEAKQEIETKLNEVDLLVKEIENAANISDDIITELKKKGSDQTVSDYAIVFQNEAKNYNALSIKWLVSGLLFSVVLVTFLLISISYELLPTELYSESNEFLRYNFTNLITKILLIAIIIFLMSFSFKQYNINRHLQTLNAHRQNALNSYQLFTKSIAGDDSNSKNALMIQVAKAIYENTQTTGFLNEKGQNFNSGIVELTKIIGKNN